MPTLAASNLLYARTQMAFSLGWHIVIACFGVGFPVLILIAEWRGWRRDDEVYQRLARRWANAFAVLFAVGAVSGTILSFELGILWPGLMGRYGEVMGLPFAMEGIAFFIEAIFLGIYLYGWDRLSTRAHLWSGVPVAVSGVASAWFVVSANAWMNQPRGFRLVNGRVVDPNPMQAIFNKAMPVQTTHMILAAYIVAGFGVASVYAWSWLHGTRDRYTKVGLLLPLTFAAIFVLPQIVVGDWAARFVAQRQPVKFAALEGLARTERGAPLRVGGLTRPDGSTIGAITIPDGLSLLARHDPHAEVQGLDAVPKADRPNTVVVRSAFQIMVLLGTALLGLAAWLAIAWRRRRDLPTSRLFMWAAFLAGPAAVVTMECGWVVTEVGRQPWTVYRVLRTSDAVTQASGIGYLLLGVVVVYTALTVATVYVLRRLARS